MTRRRRPPYPNPADLERTIDRAIEDLRAIPAMYRRLHDMTGTSPRGEGVHVRGGGTTDPTGELAMPVVVDESVDPERQRAIRDTANERLRKYARRVGADVDRIARTAGVIRDGLVNDIGPTPGFRQPRRARGGWVSQDELTESLRNQADRLAAGGE